MKKILLIMGLILLLSPAHAQFIHQEDLEVGKTYQLRKDTSMADDPYPADALKAILKMRTIDKNCTITILERTINDNGKLWYYVAVKRRDKVIDEGYVHSMACFNLSEVK